MLPMWGTWLSFCFPALAWLSFGPCNYLGNERVKGNFFLFPLALPLNKQTVIWSIIILLYHCVSHPCCFRLPSSYFSFIKTLLPTLMLASLHSLRVTQSPILLLSYLAIFLNVISFSLHHFRYLVSPRILSYSLTAHEPQNVGMLFL